MIGEGGPEVDVRDRTPLIRIRPFSILKRQGVLAILCRPMWLLHRPPLRSARRRPTA